MPTPLVLEIIPNKFALWKVAKIYAEILIVFLFPGVSDHTCLKQFIGAAFLEIISPRLPFRGCPITSSESERDQPGSLASSAQLLGPSVDT